MSISDYLCNELCWHPLTFRRYIMDTRQRKKFHNIYIIFIRNLLLLWTETRERNKHICFYKQMHSKRVNKLLIHFAIIYFSKNIKLLFRKVMERKNTWKNILLNDNSHARFELTNKVKICTCSEHVTFEITISLRSMELSNWNP